VQNLERTNIRHLAAEQLDALPDLAVIDASFISLEKVLPSTLALLKSHSDIIALIKPQFEVGKGQVGKGGVVRDPGQHLEVVEKVKFYSEQLGCRVVDVCDSPILGPKGNKEFLIHLQLERGL
jgi:23S rRNA (cytidine1920-2'-O)/16S rRNA (cytidine1409-2'-O)-methyltransferase